MINDTLISNLTAMIVAITALITAVGAILVVLKGLHNVSGKVGALSSHLVDEDGKPKIDKMEERVSTLATNIDGAMTELKETIAAKNLAVGHAEGLTEGRQASAVERQDRVTERERVEDRAESKTTPDSKPV